MRIASGTLSWTLRITAGLGIIAFLGATVGQAFLPFKLLTVLTGSMQPGLPPGSLLLLTPVDGDDLAVGDIIAFKHPSRPSDLVTHRIHEITTDPRTGERFFITKGDANQEVDGWRIPVAGKGWKFRAKIPGGGAAVEFVRSPRGRLLIVTVPALLLAGMLILEIWKDDDDADDEPPARPLHEPDLEHVA